MSIYLNYYLDMKKKQKPGEELPTLEEIKKNYMNYLLNVTQNNFGETAEILGVPQKSLEKDINE